MFTCDRRQRIAALADAEPDERTRGTAPVRDEGGLGHSVTPEMIGAVARMTASQRASEGVPSEGRR